jgi:hypothetical protein
MKIIEILFPFGETFGLEEIALNLNVFLFQ